MKRFLFLFFISTFSIAEDEDVNVDPFESTNRIVFEISDDLDTMIIRPVSYTHLRAHETNSNLV